MKKSQPKIFQAKTASEKRQDAQKLSSLENFGPVLERILNDVSIKTVNSQTDKSEAQKFLKNLDRPATPKKKSSAKKITSKPSAKVRTLNFSGPDKWESWLSKNHKNKSEVWLKIAKKISKKTSVTITEALDLALCYGWIDSQRNAFDDDYYLQRYSPRRAKSPWSQINIKRAKELIAEGRMRPSGLAEIAAAKADGRFK